MGYLKKHCGIRGQEERYPCTLMPQLATGHGTGDPGVKGRPAVYEWKTVSRRCLRVSGGYNAERGGQPIFESIKMSHFDGSKYTNEGRYGSRFDRCGDSCGSLRHMSTELDLTVDVFVIFLS